MNRSIPTRILVVVLFCLSATIPVLESIQVIANDEISLVDTKAPSDTEKEDQQKDKEVEDEKFCSTDLLKISALHMMFSTHVDRICATECFVEIPKPPPELLG